MPPILTQRLLMQRIRNGLIRYLEAVADPSVHTFFPPKEVINMWEDWVGEPLEQYCFPVFTADESAALQCVHYLWLRLIAETPAHILTYDDLYAAPVWSRYVVACRRAYRCFLVRGRLSEDVEIA
jgi:hypothetical protein